MKPTFRIYHRPDLYFKYTIFVDDTYVGCASTYWGARLFCWRRRNWEWDPRLKRFIIWEYT